MSVQTPSAVEHGITIEQVQLPAGMPYRAVCLCGWQSPIVPARPHAVEAGTHHLLGENMRCTRASHCSCGRPAREVLDGGHYGPTGYCGIPGMPPLNPCDCGHGVHWHDRSVCHIYGRGMEGITR